MSASPTSTTLEDFDPADQSAVRDLILAGLADHWGELDASANRDLDDIASTYAAGRTLVARDETGAIVGTATLMPRSLDHAEIVRMSVRRQERSHGLGRQLVVELIDTARRWTMRRVTVETSTAWTPVVDFYISCGFSVTHTTTGPHGEDTWFETVLER